MAKAATGINKKCELSEELQALIGKKSASRPEITKAIWAHIKGKTECQDGRIINPALDPKMKAVFGSKKFDMLQMAKLLSDHIG